jgi:probable HAF family extracellular repeat protein
MHLSWIHLAAALILLIATPAGAPGATYEFSTLDVPGAAATFAHAINDRGQIVGAYMAGDSWKTVGFVGSKGRFRTLDVPTSDSTMATGINNQGNIVGTFSAGEQLGFLLNQGKKKFKRISVNVPNSGDICMTRADSINNRGQIAGHYLDNCDTSSGQRGFLYGGGKFRAVDVPNASISAVTGVNDGGAVVGYYEDASTGAVLGFVKKRDVVTAIEGAFPLAINNGGKMVGYYYDGGTVRGFVSTGTSADDFHAIDFPGASSTFASGVNKAGQVVGWYTDDTGTHGFLAKPMKSGAQRSRDSDPADDEAELP